MQVGSTSSQVEDFVELSIYLTGFNRFELFSTGMVLTYYNWVRKHHETEFLSLLEGFTATSHGDTTQLQAVIKPDGKTLSLLVRSIIKLWYMGQWYDPCDLTKTEILSPESYQQGLVWNAINAHPQGAKQQGYGAWAVPPSHTEGGKAS